MMHTMTFSGYPYSRPDGAELMSLLRENTAALSDADEGRTLQLFRRTSSALQHFETLYNVAYIRNTIDTSDEFYRNEVNYFHETLPRLELEEKAWHEALLASPHLPLLKEKLGGLYFRRMEEKKRLAREENVPFQIEESRLIQDYHRAAAAASTEFRGETVNFYGLLKRMQSPDRSVRREAFTAWSDLYRSISGQLDEIYTKLVENRLKQAEVLGFTNVEEMVFLQMERFDYTREDVARFRESLCEHIVPLVSEIFEERRKALGIDRIHYYDEAMTAPEGNVVPEGTTAELLQKAQEMYRELSPETGVYFDRMMQGDMFDLETKPGKQQGGYCTFLPDLGLPFIFSNFNGTTADLDVLTHEAGHGFEAFTASGCGVPYDIVFATAEVAEIHSMSMELLTYPWMERFFGGSAEKAGRYRKSHLQDCLICLPYMACVDEFQEHVYAERLTGSADRYALWSRLEKKYMPWRNYDGNEFLENGGFWMQKQHIFMSPFYYIDYALAQICALEYYLRAKHDRTQAWNDYLRLCRAGGSEPYFRLLQRGRLSNPFAGCTVESIAEELREDVL